MLGLVGISVFLVFMYIFFMDWWDSNYVRSIRRRKKRLRKSKVIRRISVLHRAGMYETADMILKGFYK